MGIEIGFATLAWIAAIATAIAVFVVSVEIVAAFAARLSRSGAGPPRRSPATVVLVPAHDEAESIGRCLASVFSDLPPNARVLVVAHNCTDETAQVARRSGADVVEVRDDESGGKPVALKAGLRALDDEPPEVVVIVDADCVVSKEAISTLAETAWRLDRPAMGTYLFAPAGGAKGMAMLSSMATLLKNFVRPLGLSVLGLPCLLNGSGSAYPFRVIRAAPHGEGSIAEDYQLTIDLVRMGYPTVFVPQARIDSQLPAREAAALGQRRRWEHGHMFLAFRVAPRLLVEGLAHLDKNRVAIALDLAVPPLAFLALLWVIAALVALALIQIGGDTGPLILLLVAGLTLVVLVMSAWLRFAGVRRALTALLAVPRYLLWKLPLYADFFCARETRWTKTTRD
jgi:cellulose synthase/poly-beta-1,6-N-acetylglucosamine synthase-like glycosyltransferase